MSDGVAFPGRVVTFGRPLAGRDGLDEDNPSMEPAVAIGAKWQDFAIGKHEMIALKRRSAVRRWRRLLLYRSEQGQVSG